MLRRMVRWLTLLVFALSGVSACCGNGQFTGWGTASEWRDLSPEWHIQVLRHDEIVLDAMLIVVLPDAATASDCMGHIRFAMLDSTGVKLLEGTYIGNGRQQFSGIFSGKSYGKRLGRAILDAFWGIRPDICSARARRQACRPFWERVRYDIEDGRKLIRVSWLFNNTKLLIREAGGAGGGL